MQRSMGILTLPCPRVVKHSASTRRRIFTYKKSRLDDSLPYLFLAAVNLHRTLLWGMVNLCRNVLWMWWILNEWYSNTSETASMYKTPCGERPSNSLDCRVQAQTYPWARARLCNRMRVRNALVMLVLQHIIFALFCREDFSLSFNIY